MLNSDMNLAYTINTTGVNNIDTINTSPPGVSPIGQSCVTTAGANNGVCINPSNTIAPSIFAGELVRLESDYLLLRICDVFHEDVECWLQQ